MERTSRPRVNFSLFWFPNFADSWDNISKSPVTNYLHSDGQPTNSILIDSFKWMSFRCYIWERKNKKLISDLLLNQPQKHRTLQKHHIFGQYHLSSTFLLFYKHLIVTQQSVDEGKPHKEAKREIKVWINMPVKTHWNRHREQPHTYLHRSAVLKPLGKAEPAVRETCFSFFPPLTLSTPYFSPHPPPLSPVCQASGLLCWDRHTDSTLRSQHFIILAVWRRW